MVIWSMHRHAHTNIRDASPSFAVSKTVDSTHKHNIVGHYVCIESFSVYTIVHTRIDIERVSVKTITIPLYNAKILGNVRANNARAHAYIPYSL